MSAKTDKISIAARSEPISHLVTTLKKQLQFYLDRRDLSASRLARKAGVPKQSISGWLAGSNPRDIRQIKKVADTLGVSLDNLMFGQGEDFDALKTTALDSLMGDDWVGGLFEIRVRRVRKDAK